MTQHPLNQNCFFANELTYLHMIVSFKTILVLNQILTNVSLECAVQCLYIKNLRVSVPEPHITFVKKRLSFINTNFNTTIIKYYFLIYLYIYI